MALQKTHWKKRKCKCINEGSAWLADCLLQPVPMETNLRTGGFPFIRIDVAINTIPIRIDPLAIELTRLYKKDELNDGKGECTP